MDNPNTHTDNRGIIKDLVVTDEYSITYITFTEGAVRGNHYHKETAQFDLVLKGKLLCKQGNKEVVLNKQEAVSHLPGVKHAYKAVEPTEMLSICFGKRRGEHYEEDTFRLEGNDKLI